ncbi:MAG: hypothetical protein NTW16_00690 [Bacteroidetes bacterium]|nr:hypothetical protein [Bacteroidota bacterium]
MNAKEGFRTKARIRKARPDAHVKQENPTKTAPQIYAKIPGHDMAEVVEMVYRYSGRRKKLDHIFVQWPHIGPNLRRFKMTPFIKIKKRKARPWYLRQGRRLGRYIVKQVLRWYHFFADPARPIQAGPPPLIQGDHLQQTFSADAN